MFKQDIVIHCETEEEAIELGKLLIKANIKWSGGGEIDLNDMNYCGSDTVYYIIYRPFFNNRALTYGAIGNTGNYKVCTFKEFISKFLNKNPNN